MTRVRPILLLVFAFACACGGDGPKLTREELLRPESCMGCHPDHYREWSGSMHAYAADDPVFLAMNARGQRETGGALGDFCVRCHAPMALLEGATSDGTNLAEVPQHLKGVTCFFCHSVDAVEGDHNNPLRLATDLVIRGPLADARKNDGHRSTYSPLHDRARRESSALCGACHDIVTPAGLHLERTYAEWQASLFGLSDDPARRLTCGECHMTGRDGVAAHVPGVPLRRVHEHTFAGVDVALTDWPETEAQLAAIARDLDPMLLTKLCVEPDPMGVKVDVTLENFLAGHMWPSGAAQDRRAWVELVATDAGGAVLYQSGVRAAGEPVIPADPGADPDLWVLRDKLLDEEGNEVHMFWEARSVESELLTPPVTADPSDPAYYHASTRSTVLPGAVPARITLRVHIRPIDVDLVDDLVASGDLDPAVRARIPTFTLAGSVVEWEMAVTGFGCVP